MKSFYQYTIYKLYSWGLKKKGDTPIANVIITLTFVHFVQLFTLYLIALHFIPSIDIFFDVGEVHVGLFFIVFCIINYFLLYNKKRWMSYVEKYKNENEFDRKRGNYLVLVYLIGSIVLFFILLPILFGI